MMRKSSIKFGSKRENINLVEKFVEEICDIYNINNTYFGNILLALTEAVENAIIHGNKMNITKNVSLHFESGPKGLVFEVCDEGNGFDYSNIPDPTDLNVKFNENTGNGIFLIKSLADEVFFHDKGRRLQIIFHISSINKQIASERVKKLKQFNQEKKIENKEKHKPAE
jgi:serine/threonine-protein kinase RsbW